MAKKWENLAESLKQDKKESPTHQDEKHYQVYGYKGDLTTVSQILIAIT